MSTFTYKCPHCGAPINYVAGKETLKCDFCFAESTIEEVDRFNEENVSEPFNEAFFEEIKEETGETITPETKVNAYHCGSCGAEVVTDDTTTATFCYYCHNPVIVTERLSGKFRPNKVIPFKMSREDAEKNFVSWAKKFSYVPKSFYGEKQLEKITGVYLPYWMADTKTNLDIEGTGEIVSTSLQGDRETTTTKIYEIKRDGEIHVDHIGELALKKINKELVDSITPYDEKQMKDFSMGYLSGFFAETYDIERQDLETVIEERMEKYAKTLVEREFSEYSRKKLVKNKVDSEVIKWYYTLLPAWILTYQYLGKTYVYAINGQTGTAYGELPLDKKKLSFHSFGVAVVIILLFLVGGWFLW